MDNLIIKVKNQLVKSISKTPKSVNEAIDFLSKKGIEIEDIESIIQELEEKKFLNDKIFSRCWIEDRHSRKYYGPYRLKQELKKKKIDSLLIEEELHNVFEDYSKTLLVVKELVTKKIINWNGNEPLKFKQKIYNYLMRLGYASEMALTAINEKVDENSE